MPQPTDSLDEVLYFLSERMMRRAREYSKLVFAEQGFDISIDQWVILKRISEEEGISQVDLANATYKDPASVTRILDILGNKGWAERQADENSRRAYKIFLTTDGRNLVEKMLPIVQSIREKGIENLTAKEIETTKKVLRKMYGNLD
jgi:MarR family transcriptional regulator, organic hydroperoxide resistance regulator